MMFFKIDSIGNYKWKKFYGTMPCAANKFWDMEPIGDGTFICCGDGTFSTEGDPGDIRPNNTMIMRVDENANIIWYKEFDLGFYEHLTEVALSDTGFICVGSRTIPDKSVDELLWITGDFDGNYVNEHTLNYNDFNSQLIRGVVFLEDGNFVMGGSIWNNSFLLKVDQQGDTIKSLTLGVGFPESYNVTDIGETSNGILFCGTLSEDQSYGEFSAFNNYCSNNFSNIEECFFEHENEVKYSYSQKILTKSDDTFLIAGSMRTLNRGVDYWLKKLNVEDEILWQRYIGGSGFESLRDIVSTKDGGYLVIGESGSFDQYNSMYVIKVDSMGLGNYTSPVEEYEIVANNFTVYPNPADEYLIIESKNTNNSIEILIYDISGKIVIQKQTNEKQTKIKTEQLPPGIYIVKSVSEGKVNTDKLIINR